MVIDYIVATLPRMLDLKHGRSFIIDYVECPVRYFYNQDTLKLDMEYMQLPPMGENDVKFTRFARIYGDCIAHSVDGDYLPIALMEHEKQVALLGVDSDPIKIAVYRLEYNMSPKPTPKRTASGDEKPEKADKKPRSWEFVDITTLYNVVSNVMDGFSTNSIVTARTATSSHDAHRMKILACLIGLTGTDFTRSLPHMSPGIFI
jgi:hypothetical protein